MIDHITEFTELGKSSRFTNVGCGLSKSSMHVAQFLVGMSHVLEMEDTCLILGLSNLCEELSRGALSSPCYLDHENIQDVVYFDTFTQVYCFSKG